MQLEIIKHISQTDQKLFIKIEKLKKKHEKEVQTLMAFFGQHHFDVGETFWLKLSKPLTDSVVPLMLRSIN